MRRIEHPMNFTTWAGLTCALLVTVTLPAGSDAAYSNSPTKEALYVYNSAVPVTSIQGLAAEGFLLKGGKRRVLVIQVAATGIPAEALSPYVRVEVNDYAVLWDTATTTCFESGSPCTVSGVFLLDVDTAEAARPGQFARQKLHVKAYLRHDGSDALQVPMDVVLNAGFVRK